MKVYYNRKKKSTVKGTITYPVRCDHLCSYTYNKLLYTVRTVYLVVMYNRTPKIQVYNIVSYLTNYLPWYLKMLDQKDL